MKLVNYTNYDEYKARQVEANKLKFANTFADKSEIRFISKYHLENCGLPQFGLCHGVRNGFEVEKFRIYLGDNIWGSDISETAARVPNCFVWDMHEVKPGWIGSTDFIYSNSWDHTYDPRLLFERWSGCLSDNGRLYITWTTKHSDEGVTEASGYDGFGCSLDELIEIIRRNLILEDVFVVEPQISSHLIRSALWRVRKKGISSLHSNMMLTHRKTVLVLRRRDIKPSDLA